MVMCFAPDCKHYSERGECKKFFRFPKDPQEKQRWITLLRRADREPTSHSLVCSCHFKDGEKANGPTIFKHNIGKQFSFESPKKKRKSIKRVSSPTAPIGTDEASAPQEAIEAEIERFQQIAVTEAEPGSSGIQQPPQMATLKPSFAAMNEAENYFLRQQVKTLQNQIMQMRFSYEHIKHNDALVNMYTGIPTNDLYMILYNLMAGFKLNYYQKWPKANVVKELDPIDQLLLTLMKLRMNLLFDDLATRFNVSRTTASNIFVTWLYALHEVLFKNFMQKMPSREKNKLCMPSSFSSFTNCKVIIDCTEMSAIRPKHMMKQKLTYSAYKHRNTVKGLVGVAPNGVITFLSNLYPGSISDKKITEHCGVISSFVAGDLILADKGFLIQDSMPPGVVVNIPPFLSTPQFTREQAIATRTIARARIHVERAIRRIKCFHILNLVPASLMRHASVVFQVCGALTNLQFPLIREVEELYKE